MSGFSSQNRKASLDLHLATGATSCWSDVVWMAGSAPGIIHSAVCKSLCLSFLFPGRSWRRFTRSRRTRGLVHSTYWHTERLTINRWNHLHSGWHRTSSEFNSHPRVTVPSNTRAATTLWLQSIYLHYLIFRQHSENQGDQLSFTPKGLKK